MSEALHTWSGSYLPRGESRELPEGTRRATVQAPVAAAALPVPRGPAASRAGRPHSSAAPSPPPAWLPPPPRQPTLHLGAEGVLLKVLLCSEPSRDPCSGDGRLPRPC